MSHKNEKLQKQWSGQDRTIQKAVQLQLNEGHGEMQRTIQAQKTQLEKTRFQKICLSKNVWDLQERLKATRIELQFTQRQLYAAQQHLKSPSDLTQPVSAQFQTSSHRNQVGIMPLADTDHSSPNAMMADNVSIVELGARTKDLKLRSQKPRSGLMVAKSLAVGQSGFNQLTGADTKYNWLFNEEETPRQHQEPPQLNESESQLLRQQKYLAGED